MGSTFDLERFVRDVFDPVPGERVAVAVDEPTADAPDSDAWRERRAMAEDWRRGMESLGERVGFRTLPLVTFAATGRHGADFPPHLSVGGERRPVGAVLDETNLLLAMTEFSMTGALVDACKERPGADVFRAASMPGVRRWMEESSLAADYAEIQRRCRVLKSLFVRSEAVQVEFSTGHRCTFDLRFRVPESDDGYLHRDKNDDIPVINLPSGETFEVPYEGERDGEPSRTEGDLPVREADGTAVFRVEANRIVGVTGDPAAAARWTRYFEDDPARGNVAEVAFGCNDLARVTGNVLEDEKAGFHWAFGRSDHLGGTVGIARFRSPETVVHQDIVYAAGSPIEIVRADLVADDGARTSVIRDGRYTMW
jgi:hypothetical protein